MHSHPRQTSFFAIALSLLLASPVFCMDTPLSEEAVREAYFLGQRHDQGMADLLNRYVQYPPLPETGPYVSSVAFYTPYAVAVLDSSQRSFNYDAQDAERDHFQQQEIVRVVIQVWLTASYGPNLMRPTNSRDAAPIGIGFRSSDFWKDFRVHVYNEDRRDEKQVFPVDAGGQPMFSCGEDGGCTLSGATMHFDFPAEAFTADCATIHIDPPEGATVSVEFAIASLR